MANVCDPSYGYFSFFYDLYIYMHAVTLYKLHCTLFYVCFKRLGRVLWKLTMCFLVWILVCSCTWLAWFVHVAFSLPISFTWQTFFTDWCCNHCGTGAPGRGSHDHGNTGYSVLLLSHRNPGHHESVRCKLQHSRDKY